MVLAILTVLLIITVAGVNGQQDIGTPLNTLAVVGKTAKLGCKYHLNSCREIRWQKLSATGQVTNISDGNRVLHTDRRFQLDNTSVCILVIEDVKLADSGTFKCTIAGTDSGFGDLIVLQDMSSCSSSCVSDTTPENETVNFKCNLEYSGGGKPEMTWWTDVPNVPSQKREGGKVSREFSGKAVAPWVAPLVCSTRFIFDQTTGRALNIPEVLCKTEACNVTYPVRDVEIFPVGYASPGELITCRANGNPRPTFQWQWKEDGEDGEWEDVPEATSATIEAFLVNGTSTQFRCAAKNQFKGEEHSDESDEVTVSKYGALIRIGITVGVIAAVLLVAGIAGLVHKFCLSE